ncbi:MAG TPA: exodeoxyribonuclease V subunit gamma [Phycisphaerae bacterium]|nr:exodeoxyribonuclease V subunit gamma [Phycisphaerae bacterium]
MATSATVTLLLGPARSRKAATVRTRYLDLVADCPPGDLSRRVLLLVPTGTRRQTTIDALLRESRDGLLVQPNVWTFPQYAEWALGQLGAPVRRATELQRHGILAAALAWCAARKQLRYLLPIADRRGLVDSLADVIRRLKTEAIRPQDFARAAAKSGLARDLAAVYTRYQHQFETSGLYDDAGLFWQAREALAAAKERFPWPAHVLVDGFQDFSSPQRAILRTLYDHGAQLVVTLPCCRERPELFAPTLRTLDHLQTAFDHHIAVEEFPAPDATTPLARVQESLFDDSAATPHPDAASAVTFAETAGYTREVEFLAQRIKQCLVADTDGRSSDRDTIQPADVAIILPARQPYEDLIARVFPSYGIPVNGLSGTSLIRMPLVRWLLELLRLPLNSFAYGALVGVLRSPYFPCELLDAEPRTLEAACRMLHCVGAFEGLADHVEALRDHSRRLREGSLSGDADAAESAAEADLADKVVLLLQRLAARLGVLPQRASRAHHLAATRTLVAECRFRSAAIAANDRELAARDLACLSALEAVIAEMSGLDEYAPADSLTAADFVAELEEALAAATVAPPRHAGGAVHVLDTRSSRALTFKVVALPGLTDGLWPQPMRSDLADAPQSQDSLAGAGLSSPDRRDHLAEQRFLFYMAASRASQHLIVTRPAADEAGRPLCASPFWADMARAVFGRPHPEVHVVTARDAEQPTEGIAGPEALRRAAMSALASPDARGLAVLAAAHAVDSVIRPTCHAAAVILERESPRPFGRFDGVLSDGRIAEALASTYPSARPLSITSLEHFAQCPFWFFAETVCRLDAVEPPEETLLDDQAGLLYHDILCEFYRTCRLDQTVGARLNRVPPDRLRHAMSQAVDRVFARRSGQTQSTLPALLAIQREDIREQLLAYVEAEAERCADLAYDLEPLVFEWSFGMPVPDNAAGESTESPAVVPSPYGPIRLRGRVDRIDRATDATAGRAWLEIVDYKSGSRPGNLASRLRDGLVLQLPLYLLAADQLLSRSLKAPAGLGAYYYLRDVRHHVGVTLTGDKADSGRELVELATARAVAAIAACRRGEFPPVSADECPSYCPYDRLCRAARWRVDRKMPEARP